MKARERAQPSPRARGQLQIAEGLRAGAARALREVHGRRALSAACENATFAVAGCAAVGQRLGSSCRAARRDTAVTLAARRRGARLCLAR